MINTDLAVQNDHPESGLVPLEAKSCRHWRSLLVVTALLCLPGFSGCQKTPPQTHPTPPEATSPPTPLPPEAGPSVTPSKTQSAAQPSAEGNGSKQPAENLSEQKKSSPASPKSSTKGGNGSKVGSGTIAGGGSPTGTSADQTTSSQSGRSPQTASAALELAQSLRRTSTQAANRGDFGKAFGLAAQAWEVLRPFPHDAACRAVTGQLTIELESLGDRANAAVAPGAARTKTLVER